MSPTMDEMDVTIMELERVLDRLRVVRARQLVALTNPGLAYAGETRTLKLVPDAPTCTTHECALACYTTDDPPSAA